MKASSQKLLDKAARAIRAAELLAENGDADFALGRAYYAMFYTASALLEEPRLRARKRSGVHALFGEHFAKAGRMDAKFHRWLLQAFAWRLQGDYGFEAEAAPEEVSDLIEQAREFLASAQAFLGLH